MDSRFRGNDGMGLPQGPASRVSSNRTFAFVPVWRLWYPPAWRRKHIRTPLMPSGERGFPTAHPAPHSPSYVIQARTGKEATMPIRAALLSTTHSIPGRETSQSLGVISAECVLGINVFRDLFGVLRDFVGGRSGTHQKALREAKETCLRELAKEAEKLGADAVVGNFTHGNRLTPLSLSLSSGPLRGSTPGSGSASGAGPGPGRPGRRGRGTPRWPALRRRRRCRPRPRP